MREDEGRGWCGGRYALFEYGSVREKTGMLVRKSNRNARAPSHARFTHPTGYKRKAKLPQQHRAVCTRGKNCPGHLPTLSMAVINQGVRS